MPYALSGSQWANTNMSVSYLPDGTWDSGYQSDLFALYNAQYTTATWQYQFARALQTWADASQLNFHFVPDDGSQTGISGLAQGDPRFGDIRLGATLGVSNLGWTWFPSKSTPTAIGGTITLNGFTADVMGSVPDLYSVLLHESGHALGLDHSLVLDAVMAPAETGVFSGLTADDIAGIQALYGARQPDVYDARASNDTLATATPLTLSSGAITITADLTSLADLDYYRITVPSGSNGTMTVSVDARNLSLLDPKVSVYDASGNLVATASASIYGSVATVSLTGLVAGQNYYLVADGATSDVFGMGAYKLSVQFGGITAPTIAPDQYDPNGTVATAANMGTISSLSLTGLTLDSATNVDYYKASAASKGSFVVSVTPAPGSGTLSVTVLSAGQAVLASCQSQTSSATLSVSLASGQQFYVRVSSPTGSCFTYDLSIGKCGGTGGKSAKGGALMLAPAPGGEGRAGAGCLGSFRRSQATFRENTPPPASRSASEFTPPLGSFAGLAPSQQTRPGRDYLPTGILDPIRGGKLSQQSSPERAYLSVSILDPIRRSKPLPPTWRGPASLSVAQDDSSPDDDFATEVAKLPAAND